MVLAPFPMLVALLPLAIYLTLFGILRLTGRPIVTTGARDIFAIAIAICGLVLVGPAELFFPTAAATLFGVAIWPVLAFLYFLLTILIVLSSRPRLIVYGLSPTGMTDALLRAAQTLDRDAVLDAQAGTVTMPTSGLHLRLEGHRGTDTSEVVAFESNVSPVFWVRLRSALAVELKAATTVPRRGGLTLALGLGILILLSTQFLAAPEAVVQGFRDWVWR